MRSHFLHSVFGLTALGAALVACGDDAADGGGGSGGASSADSGSTTAQAGPATVGAQQSVSSGATIAGVGPSTTDGPGPGPGPGSGGSTGSSGNCENADPLFADDGLNECGFASCCAEMLTCLGDPTLCFDTVTNQLDESLPAAADLVECMEGAGCFGFGVCESGLAFTGDTAEEFATCLGDNCCDEFSACTSDGTDVQGCIDCLNGDQANYDLCEEANACAVANCDSGVIFAEICDSGLGLSDPAVAECLTENCCEPIKDCVGDTQEETDACIECFNAGGGPECDAAIECEDTNCNTGVCDSGIGVGDVDLAACLTTNCCDEYTACTKDGTDVESCLDCFNGDPPGGALCDDAITCGDTNCGGEGGGGTGGGGGAGGGG